MISTASTSKAPATPTAPAPSQQTTSSWGAKPESGVAAKTSAPTANQPTAMKETTSGAKTSWGGTETGGGKVQNASTARAQAYANKNLVADKARAASVQNSVKNTTSADWGAARTSYASGKQSYTPTTTPPKRSGEENRVIVNKYYNTYSSGGMMYGYADPFNHSMMFMFSTMWWMNMWGSVDHSHYQNDARYRELEKEVAVLKAQQGANWKPNPNYRDPNMTDTVMYSDGYLQAVKEGKLTPETLDKTAKEAKSGEDEAEWLFAAFAGGILTTVVILAVFVLVKQRRNRRK